MTALMPPPSLHGSHLRTYEKIFQHPVSHNLPWRDVLALFSHLGDVEVETGGRLRVMRQGHTLILPTPRTKDVDDVDMLMQLRRFLEHSETPLTPSVAPTGRVLVVIDHNGARLFSLDAPDAGRQLLLPDEPAENFRRAHVARDFASGKSRPAPAAFFALVAEALRDAGPVLIFGTGTGTSSEMDQFTAWAKKQYPDLARRITSARAVDEHHLTEAQLVALAREVFARGTKA
jgi:hypothetical protein